MAPKPNTAIIGLLLFLNTGLVAWVLEAHPFIGCIPKESSPTEKIKGVTIAPIEDIRLGPVGYGSSPCAEALAEISDLGATWISVTPFGRMDDLEDTEILHDFEIPLERNEEMIRETSAMARALNIKVALIPHIYVMSGDWRGEIDPGSNDCFREWFFSYDEFIERYAALAEEIGADLFSIGVEFKSSTNYYSDRWRQTIELVRSVYSGPLTYSANWDEVEEVEFWDDLDFIGVNAFWPLAGKPGDGFDEMLKRAGIVAEDLGALAFYWNRPVLFTEFGVKSVRDGALAPWEWPEHCADQVYDESYQEAVYQAVLETMARQQWFEGLFIWKYFADPYDETQEARSGFSPRGKSAEKVLARWFFRDWDSDCFDLVLE